MLIPLVTPNYICPNFGSYFLQQNLTMEKYVGANLVDQTFTVKAADVTEMQPRAQCSNSRSFPLRLSVFNHYQLSPTHIIFGRLAVSFHVNTIR